jgi:hypothetical protein
MVKIMDIPNSSKVRDLFGEAYRVCTEESVESGGLLGPSHPQRSLFSPKNDKDASFLKTLSKRNRFVKI